MTRLLVLLALVAFASSVCAAPYEQYSICSNKHCTCSEALHPIWTTINCTIPEDVRIDIHSTSLPVSTTDLTVQGGKIVMFGAGTFNSVRDMRRILVKGAKQVEFKPGTGVNLNVVTLLLDIEDCTNLLFEKRAFINLKGPLSISIINCDGVTVVGDTFSWLLSLKISNVTSLALGSGSFSLDPTAANVGDHGPGMSIEIANTVIPEFSKLTFGSSAAKILFEGVDIQAIRSGAFSANTYNVVMAVNCSIHQIEEDAFSENSLINYLNLNNCKINMLGPKAMRSAIGSINITKSRFENVMTGAINTTVATVNILGNEFHTFKEKGFELSSWNTLQMIGNTFDELPTNAIAAPTASIHKLIFEDNEIETMHEGSLSFIGNAAVKEKVAYKSNYYGQACFCNISQWLAKAMGQQSTDLLYEQQSYCTVDEFFARCFNEPDQNMLVSKFLHEVCSQSPQIKCEKFKSKIDGALTEIKNPRFPHKNYQNRVLSDRNKKVIGIVIVTCLGCFIIAVVISLIRWLRNRGHCINFKNLLISSNNSCRSLCGRLCTCGTTGGIDNTMSISHLSVNEYSERHCLNESRSQDQMQDSSFQTEPTDVVIEMDDKFTQTLPEELTKELLDNLKKRLDSPENYVEAREMIEHLYELTKTIDTPPKPITGQENIYELPFQNTTGRVGRNNQKMVSVGTDTPSLDQLLPLSPYNRQTALVHEYFEPKDLAVHLYAEIVNGDKEMKSKLSSMPDVIVEQPIPRGPYLRAVLQPNSFSPNISANLSPPLIRSPEKSTVAMVNRPLPEKPLTDPGEGTSKRHG